MKSLITIVFVALFAPVTWAADITGPQSENGVDIGPVDAFELDLNDFLWLKRPVVVFADTPADPRFRQQIELLTARPDALRERDVVIITDADPDAESAIRQKLRPRGFMLVLIGKDGEVELRKPSPWDVRELTRVIDKMPTRQQELRDNRPPKP